LHGPGRERHEVEESSRSQDKIKLVSRILMSSGGILYGGRPGISVTDISPEERPMIRVKSEI
jgi:hypothetical protein